MKTEGDLRTGAWGGRVGCAHGDQLRSLHVSASIHVRLCVGSVVAGALTCSRVAKVSVCPQALLTLKEQTLAFGQETRRSLLKEDSWHSVEGRMEASVKHQVFFFFPCLSY